MAERELVGPGDPGWHEAGDECAGFTRHVHQRARPLIVYGPGAPEDPPNVVDELYEEMRRRQAERLREAPVDLDRVSPADARQLDELMARAGFTRVPRPGASGGSVVPRVVLDELVAFSRARNPYAPTPLRPWPRPSIRQRISTRVWIVREALALRLAPWLRLDRDD